MKMNNTALLAGFGLLAAGLAVAAPAYATQSTTPGPLGAGMTIYMQMGGNPGDGATLPRQVGAADASHAFGIKVIEQYSAWNPETMLDQFRQALAARPTCIAITGHPGDAAFGPLIAKAEAQGIIVTVGNTPLPQVAKNYVGKGAGYAGVDLYIGGGITAQAMLAAGLKAGDEALEYGVFNETERSQSDRGLRDTLEKAGVKVTTLNISPQVDSDSSLAVPILVAFIESHPKLKAIGTQHGGVTGFIPQALRQAGKAPGQIIVGGIDLAPSTIAGLQGKYITATLDQQLYLQGFLPVTQCVLSAAYHFAGMSINTGAGVETPQSIDALIPLIKRGIR
ncbi:MULTISPECIES: substrate-binding domain-containing protein [unclassified Acidisoma]|jgi:simple sugar transport system substrate-binding protein|uniref:substrate-binding domain-containing protein n=1 Tax=unclassified Acidisoma TaxID=2634065 RepID=UPI00131BA755|nr:MULTISPECIES: substrate-binding domain-containing protein [unclassified Acidisoma]